jgi:hypothetical protein
MTDREFWQQIYAALLKQAHDYQELRAGVLQQAAAIEKQFGLRKNAITKIVEIQTGDSYAFIAEVVTQKKE